MLAVYAIACASSEPRPPARKGKGAPSATAPNAYLLPPTDGWSGALDDQQREPLAAGFNALAREGDAASALTAADMVLARTPDFPPALVLAAQANLVKGTPANAKELLSGWIDREPNYRAARLLWARVLELTGDPAGAHAAYRALADLPIAADRARATREPAVAAAQTALAAAVAARRLDEARVWADRIAEWESPDSPAALEARLQVARAAGDQTGELEVLRTLHDRGRSDRELLERLASLELEHGDPDRALHLLEGLVAEYPDDAALHSQLAAAQLGFRLRLLPENVRKVAARPELTRGDYAALLYWVVPGVRQTQGGSARIASDVLDHPWQQEIVRVVNRGLMKVDAVMHNFAPDRSITRAEALQSALEVAATRPGGDCAKGVAASSAPATAAICDAATRCKILNEAAECLPQGGLSGGEALGILGRALSLQKTE